MIFTWPSHDHHMTITWLSHDFEMIHQHHDSSESGISTPYSFFATFWSGCKNGVFVEGKARARSSKTGNVTFVWKCFWVSSLDTWKQKVVGSNLSETKIFILVRDIKVKLWSFLDHFTSVLEIKHQRYWVRIS